MAQLSLAKDKITVVLLEGIAATAVETLRGFGYSNIRTQTKSLDEAALADMLADAHIVGIRSRTQLTETVLRSARKLFCVGCFCIGTDQVDLATARRLGIPVFNAPYSNTRSVAELMIAEIIMLFRGVQPKSFAVHRGEWPKSAANANEIRGKILGIVGYGHIGSQLSVLAEAMGMQVRYFDIQKKLAIGNAVPCPSLEAVLAVSDVVSLHVPDTPQTRNLIRAEQLAVMKPGSFLLNASRGKVVDIDALAGALRSGHLLGAALDVFPKEPKSRDDLFESSLRGMEQVILTPHIGGSTEEAQANIGHEVAEKLAGYSDIGSTVGAVNFPQVALPVQEQGIRFLHIHENRPGLLSEIDRTLSAGGLNLSAQYLQTEGDLGYVVTDVTATHEDDATRRKLRSLREDLRTIGGTIRARFLF